MDELVRIDDNEVQNRDQGAVVAVEFRTGCNVARCGGEMVVRARGAGKQGVEGSSEERSGRRRGCRCDASCVWPGLNWMAFDVPA